MLYIALVLAYRQWSYGRGRHGMEVVKISHFLTSFVSLDILNLDRLSSSGCELFSEGSLAK